MQNRPSGAFRASLGGWCDKPHTAKKLYHEHEANVTACQLLGRTDEQAVPGPGQTEWMGLEAKRKGYRTMANKNSRSVFRRNSQWVNKLNGAQRASSVHDSQRAAHDHGPERPDSKQGYDRSRERPVSAEGHGALSSALPGRLRPVTKIVAGSDMALSPLDFATSA